MIKLKTLDGLDVLLILRLFNSVVDARKVFYTHLSTITPNRRYSKDRKDLYYYFDKYTIALNKFKKHVQLFEFHEIILNFFESYNPSTLFKDLPSEIDAINYLTKKGILKYE